MIKGYHSSHNESYKFITSKLDTVDIDNNEFIGFELEVENPNVGNLDREDFTDELEREFPNLFFERDGSLNFGFEIISQPHTFDAIIHDLNLKKLLKRLSDAGYISHDSPRCGLHFHFTRPNNDLNGTKIIKRLNYLVNVKFKDDLIRLSRRRDFTYCQFRPYTGNRRVSLNLGNRNTIEFRFFRGTLNYNTFVESMLIVLKLVKLAKTDSLWDNSSRTKLKYNISILSILTKYGVKLLMRQGGNPYHEYTIPPEMGGTAERSERDI